ncbi:hypothetical protein F5Y06DRAFT_298763 [Hypoxylon sp. FL0890]|nr:hypothetical protein F5Y06DRAFT_298763 [Hypoxylon sp. FL0890]
MDWPCAEADFNDHDFGTFKYQHRPFKIIRKLRSDKELKCWNIESPEDLQRWIDENRIPIRDSCEYGTFAILFSRGVDARLSCPLHIPVTMDKFYQLIQLFHIHRMIVRTICRKITYFSRLYSLRENPGGNIVYTARMSSSWPEDIAMSSTHLSHKRLNLSVFYGCGESQASKIMKRLEMARNAIYHPMLPAGILVELDRDRMVEQVSSAFDSFIQKTEDLCFTSCDPERIMDKDGESTGQLSYLYNDTRELVKGIRKVKSQISDMCSHIRELHKRKRGSHKRLRPRRRADTDFDAYSNTSSVATRIYERLQEIEAEYDEKLDQCHMVTDGLAFSTQLAADRANIQIAVDTRQENARMRLISLVTMVYLPVTSVATIFSMGVFNWTAASQQSVFTFYFWIYIAIAGGLTVVTVGSWWALTRTTPRRMSDSTTDLASTISSTTYGREDMV